MVGEGAAVLVRRALAAAGLAADETAGALERFLAIYDGACSNLPVLTPAPSTRHGALRGAAGSPY